MSAVTEQGYNATTDNGSFLLTTFIAWPYVLNTPTSENSVYQTTIVLSSDCTPIAGSPCSQVWLVTIDASMSSYSDDAFSISTLAYTANMPMYFGVEVDAAAVVSSVMVTDVFVMVVGSLRDHLLPGFPCGHHQPRLARSFFHFQRR